MTIRNPVLRGTEPDPSIVRVGSDFFLATSSFGLLPGVLIRHSTDLVNWTILGGAITRPEQYRRDGAEGAVMLFAPTLRYADGWFCIACTNVADNQGNFVVTAKDPRGPWSDALWLDRGGFDPSLLYDEGRWLYTRRSMRPNADGFLGPVEQAELEIETGALGEFRALSPGLGGFQSNDIEGPHLYRIGDWYYLLSAEGGTWKGHMETAARSNNPWGPFEPAPKNPVLTHRHRVGHPIQSLGHADLVDDRDGNWWAVFLGTRHESAGGFAVHHNLGRETFLAPVVWSDDGWPEIGASGTVEMFQDHPFPLPEGARRSQYRGEPGGWSTFGWRTIGASSEGIDATAVRARVPRGPSLGRSGPGALLLAQTEDRQVFEAQVSKDDLEGAGVAVYADDSHFYALVVHLDSNVTALASLTRRVDDLEVTEQRAVDIIGTLIFRIRASAESYVFEVAGDSASPVVVGAGRARLLSAETTEWFTGVHYALVAEGDSTSIDFDQISRTP